LQKYIYTHIDLNVDMHLTSTL